MRILTGVLSLAACAASCGLVSGQSLLGQLQSGQSRVIGTVASTDATSTGVLEVSSGRSVLGSSSSVSAGQRAARVTLMRGGELDVCQGSTARLTAGTGSAHREPLVVGLDRGALELRMDVTSADAIMTPDLRITVADGKEHPLDLALRVTAKGDTCIDNRGRKAPAVNVGDAFGTGTYQVKSGQRVLFEHGSLHEVVDREQGPCGCPAPAGTSVAGAKGFPFPEAVSEGLSDPTPPPPETAGGTHTQVSSVLNADPGIQVAGSAPPPPAPAPAPSQNPGFFSSIGLFFKHLFAR